MCAREPGCARPRFGPRERGLTLVELVVFIAVVGVAVAGVLMALDVSTRASADPMIRKQALAIAEAFLEEAQAMPFTYCDPDDANAPTADGAAGCATTAESAGPEPGEDRYGSGAPFDNVNDYHAYDSAADPPGLKDLAGNVVSGLEGYRVQVTVAQQALGAIPAAESLLITVTVDCPANTSVVLHGYRTRYAPNALP